MGIVPITGREGEHVEAHERVGSRDREVVTGRGEAETIRGAAQAARSGEEIEAARAETCDGQQVDGHRPGGDRGAADADDDLVADARGAELEAEGRAAGQRQGAGRSAQGQDLGGGVDEIEGARGADGDGGHAARAEAGLQRARIDGDGVRAGIPRRGAREDELAHAGLGQVAGARIAHRRQREDAGRIRDLDGRAGRTELDGMVGRQGQRARRGVSQGAAVDGNEVGGAAVAEVSVGGELQLSFGDRDRPDEGVGRGEDDGAGSGLVDAAGAGKDPRDRAGAQQEVGRRGKAAGGAGDGARIQGHHADRLAEDGEIERTAAERHGARVGEHFVATQREGAGIDIGAARVGVRGAKGELAVADLGESGRGVGRGERREGHRGAGAAAADQV